MKRRLIVLLAALAAAFPAKAPAQAAPEPAELAAQLQTLAADAQQALNERRYPPQADKNAYQALRAQWPGFAPDLRRPLEPQWAQVQALYGALAALESRQTDLRSLSPSLVDAVGGLKDPAQVQGNLERLFENGTSGGGGSAVLGAPSKTDPQRVPTGSNNLMELNVREKPIAVPMPAQETVSQRTPGFAGQPFYLDETATAAAIPLMPSGTSFPGVLGGKPGRVFKDEAGRVHFASADGSLTRDQVPRNGRLVWVEKRVFPNGDFTETVIDGKRRHENRFKALGGDRFAVLSDGKPWPRYIVRRAKDGSFAVERVENEDGTYNVPTQNAALTGVYDERNRLKSVAYIMDVPVDELRHFVVPPGARPLNGGKTVKLSDGNAYMEYEYRTPDAYNVDLPMLQSLKGAARERAIDKLALTFERTNNPTIFQDKKPDEYRTKVEYRAQSIASFLKDRMRRGGLKQPARVMLTANDNVVVAESCGQDCVEELVGSFEPTLTGWADGVSKEREVRAETVRGEGLTIYVSAPMTNYSKLTPEQRTKRPVRPVLQYLGTWGLETIGVSYRSNMDDWWCFSGLPTPGGAVAVNKVVSDGSPGAGCLNFSSLVGPSVVGYSVVKRLHLKPDGTWEDRGETATREISREEFPGIVGVSAQTLDVVGSSIFHLGAAGVGVILASNPGYIGLMGAVGGDPVAGEKDLWKRTEANFVAAGDGWFGYKSSGWVDEYKVEGAPEELRKSGVLSRNEATVFGGLIGGAKQVPTLLLMGGAAGQVAKMGALGELANEGVNAYMTFGGVQQSIDATIDLADVIQNNRLDTQLGQQALGQFASTAFSAPMVFSVFHPGAHAPSEGGETKPLLEEKKPVVETPTTSSFKLPTFSELAGRLKVPDVVDKLFARGSEPSRIEEPTRVPVETTPEALPAPAKPTTLERGKTEYYSVPDQGLLLLRLSGERGQAPYVRVLSEGGAWRVIAGGESRVLHPGETLHIGRDPPGGENAQRLVIPASDGMVSRDHLTLSLEEGGKLKVTQNGQNETEVSQGLRVNGGVEGRQLGVLGRVYATDHVGGGLEIVRVDPASDPELAAKIEAGEKLAQSIGGGESRLLQATYDVLKMAIPYSSEGAGRLEARNNNTIMIGNVKEGVCRHQALAASAMLESYKAQGLLQGEVHYVVGNGHAWTEYVSPEGRSTIIDVAQDYVGPPDQVFNGSKQGMRYSEFQYQAAGSAVVETAVPVVRPSPVAKSPTELAQSWIQGLQDRLKTRRLSPPESGGAIPRPEPTAPSLERLGPLPEELSPQARRGLYDGLYTDPLTGLGNPRYLEAHAPELQAAYDHVLMMDGDSFGAIDRLLTARYGEKGKAVADEVLARMVSNARASAEKAVGKENVVAVRKGGEEIAFFVKGDGVEAAAEAVRRSGARFNANGLELDAILPAFGISDDPAAVMKAIDEQAAEEAAKKSPESARGPPPTPGTISVGAASIDKALDPAAALREAMKKADLALTASKDNGKNLATIFSETGHKILERVEGEPAAEKTRDGVEMTQSAQRTQATRKAAELLQKLDPEAYARYIEQSERDPISGAKDFESIRANLDGLLAGHDHVLILEVDAFKAFNDHPELGHDIGDAALKGFGETAKQTARELGLDKKLLIADAGTDVHIARARGKEFHVLGSEADLQRFQDALQARLRTEDPIITGAARAYFNAESPTPEQVAAVRQMAETQARKLGKNPARVGQATGAIEPIDLKSGAPSSDAYEAAVSRALARVEELKNPPAAVRPTWISDEAKGIDWSRVDLGKTESIHPRVGTYDAYTITEVRLPDGTMAMKLEAKGPAAANLRADLTRRLRVEKVLTDLGIPHNKALAYGSQGGKEFLLVEMQTSAEGGAHPVKSLFSQNGAHEMGRVREIYEKLLSAGLMPDDIGEALLEDPHGRMVLGQLFNVREAGTPEFESARRKAESFIENTPFVDGGRSPRESLADHNRKLAVLEDLLNGRDVRDMEAFDKIALYNHVHPSDPLAKEIVKRFLSNRVPIEAEELSVGLPDSLRGDKPAYKVLYVGNADAINAKLKLEYEDAVRRNGWEPKPFELPFQPGTPVEVFVYKEPTQVARAYTEGKTGAQGYWVFTKGEVMGADGRPKAGARLQKDLALPNTPDRLALLEIPANTVGYRAIGASAFGQEGGKPQLYLRTYKETYRVAKTFDLTPRDYVDTNVLIAARAKGTAPERGGKIAAQTAVEASQGGPDMRRYILEQIKAGRISMDTVPRDMTPAQRSTVDRVERVLADNGLEPKDARILAQIYVAGDGSATLYTKERRLTNQMTHDRPRIESELEKAGLDPARLPRVVRLEPEAKPKAADPLAANANILQKERLDQVPEGYRRQAAAKSLPKVELLRVLSREGASSVVFEGRLPNGKAVAVKVYGDANPGEWADSLRYFRNEVRMGRFLVEVLPKGWAPRWYGEVDVGGNPAIAMEVVKGKETDDLTVAQAAELLSDRTIKRAMVAVELLRQKGLGGKDSPQPMIATEDQVVNGARVRRGDPVFIDAGALTANSAKWKSPQDLAADLLFARAVALRFRDSAPDSTLFDAATTRMTEKERRALTAQAQAEAAKLATPRTGATAPGRP